MQRLVDSIKAGKERSAGFRDNVIKLGRSAIDIGTGNWGDLAATWIGSAKNVQDALSMFNSWKNNRGYGSSYLNNVSNPSGTDYTQTSSDWMRGG
jgi:hypothetical protein